MCDDSGSKLSTIRCSFDKQSDFLLLQKVLGRSVLRPLQQLKQSGGYLEKQLIVKWAQFEVS